MHVDAPHFRYMPHNTSNSTESCAISDLTLLPQTHTFRQLITMTPINENSAQNLIALNITQKPCLVHLHDTKYAIVVVVVVLHLLKINDLNSNHQFNSSFFTKEKISKKNHIHVSTKWHYCCNHKYILPRIFELNLST